MAIIQTARKECELDGAVEHEGDAVKRARVPRRDELAERPVLDIPRDGAQRDPAVITLRVTIRLWSRSPRDDPVVARSACRSAAGTPSSLRAFKPAASAAR
jgi:hypothetical protein